jgi:hypothetical protein
MDVSGNTTARKVGSGGAPWGSVTGKIPDKEPGGRADEWPAGSGAERMSYKNTRA